VLILVPLTPPINLLTLGLFTLVIKALIREDREGGGRTTIDLIHKGHHHRG
jgi:hypothetical protein